jgi:excisionase family DNA binding protein
MAKLMTLQEVADYLRVTTKTVSRLLKIGGIPASKIGRQWRFEQALIDSWLSQRPVSITFTVLVIDDDDAICSLIQDTLEGAGYMVTTSSESSKGLELVKNQDYDLIFLDLKMPGMDGAELLRQIKIAKPKLPVIIITGYRDSDLMMNALTYGPLGVVGKPFRGSDILDAVDNYVRFGISRK